MGAITSLVERWVSQDAARANAARAASRLHHQRRELDDVNRYLAKFHQPDLGKRRSVGPP